MAAITDAAEQTELERRDRHVLSSAWPIGHPAHITGDGIDAGGVLNRQCRDHRQGMAAQAGHRQWARLNTRARSTAKASTIGGGICSLMSAIAAGADGSGG
jgi:hypothetical protein